MVLFEIFKVNLKLGASRHFNFFCFGYVCLNDPPHSRLLTVFQT